MFFFLQVSHFLYLAEKSADSRTMHGWRVICGAYIQTSAHTFVGHVSLLCEVIKSIDENAD